MSINVASSCKQFLDICRKSNKAVVHLWQEGALFLVTCEATFFSPKRPICGHSHSGGNFLLAHCLSSGKRIGNMSARFYMRVCGGFLRGFTILILSSQSNPLLWSGQKADLGQECCSREFTICILCIQEAYFWEGWVLVFAFLVLFMKKWNTQMKYFLQI